MVNIYSGTISTVQQIHNIARYLVPPNTNISFGGTLINANASQVGWLQIQHDGYFWLGRRTSDNFTNGANTGYTKQKIRNSTEVPYYVLSTFDAEYNRSTENRQARLEQNPSSDGTQSPVSGNHIHICYKTSEISDANHWRDQIYNLINGLSYTPYFDNGPNPIYRPFGIEPIYLESLYKSRKFYDPKKNEIKWA